MKKQTSRDVKGSSLPTPKNSSAICYDCGRTLKSFKDRIECKGSKCICPECYRAVVSPYGGKRHDPHCL